MSTRRSVVIPGKSEDCQRWQPPTVDGDVAHSTNVSLVTAKQIEGIQNQAYDEGFSQGHHEGMAEAKRQLEPILSSLAEPLADFDETVMEELATLIKVVAQQLVRRELATKPDEIVAVVRDAITALPIASANVSVHLHPEDAMLVRNALSIGDEPEHDYRIVEDPTQGRGGCRVLTENSEIDASMERRLTAVVAKMLGGSRHDDSGST